MPSSRDQRHGHTQHGAVLRHKEPRGEKPQCSLLPPVRSALSQCLLCQCLSVNALVSVSPGVPPVLCSDAKGREGRSLNAPSSPSSVQHCLRACSASSSVWSVSFSVAVSVPTSWCLQCLCQRRSISVSVAASVSQYQCQPCGLGVGSNVSVSVSVSVPVYQWVEDLRQQYDTFSPCACSSASAFSSLTF